VKPKLPKDYATVHFLKWWYCHLNRELVKKGVFKRLLPIPLAFGFNAPHDSVQGSMPETLALTTFDETTVSSVALISTIQWCKFFCLTTLVHEMVHIHEGREVGCKRREKGHKKFWKKIREVYGSGVLDGWL